MDTVKWLYAMTLLVVVGFIPLLNTVSAEAIVDCTAYSVTSPKQACIGPQRSWQMTGDDTVSKQPVTSPSNPTSIVINVSGSTVDFIASAPRISPGNGGGLFEFDKFYIITDNQFHFPTTLLFNEVIGPFYYGLPPNGNAIQFGPSELGRIAAMKNVGNGGLVIIEEEAGCFFFGDPCVGYGGAEGYAPIEFSGELPPPSPPLPTPVTGVSVANIESSGEAADPINTFTGELFNSYMPDINLGGPMPLLFSRYYASTFTADGINGTMGSNWRHNFEWSLTPNAALVSNATIIDIISNRGRLIRFVKKTNLWQLSGRKDIAYKLIEDNSTNSFILIDPRTNYTWLFNSSGQLTAIRDSVGNTHTLTYDSDGLLTQVTDGLLRVLNFSYNSSNKLEIVDDGQGRRIGFTYLRDNLIKVIDSLNFGVQGGKATIHEYTANSHLLTAITKSQGNTIFTQTWDTANKVARQTDALGNTTMLSYAGNATTITDALGRDMTHTHTATGELNSVLRRDGTSIALVANAIGQRNGITDSLGASTGFTYDPASGRVAAITHANGSTTSKTFVTRILASGVKLFDLASITHADNTTDTFTSDANGNITSITDRAGKISSFTRNANGQWLTKTNRLGGVASRMFNADATMAKNTDVSGNTTTFTYDTYRRPAVITYADNSTQLFTYDLLDRPLSFTDNRGVTTSMGYDANSNLISSINRTGAITTFGYDVMDRVNKITDDDNNSSIFNYDKLGRLEETTDPNGSIVGFGYDPQNRLNAITDGNGNVFHRSFDNEGILATTSTPLGNVTTFTSDNMGRITQTSSPLGNNIQFRYDTMGRITKITNPLGTNSTITYDSRGFIASNTLPGAISASYTRNAMGRITQITDPNGNNWLQTFDLAGRITAITDPLTRHKTFTYDSRNRLSTVTYPGTLGTLTNTYDANGNLTRKLYSDGTELNFTFDPEDRLLTANGLTLIRDNLGRIINSNGIIMTYDAGGRIASITYGTGKSVNYTYDGNNNLKTVTDWLSGISTFTYDADNRLTSMTRPNELTSRYSYNNDGQLIGFIDGTLGETTLTRDANSRITAANRIVPTAATAGGMTTIKHSFDAAAQVSTVGFSYDALGRQTTNGTTVFTWDLASRLIGKDATLYTYDALGYRLSRTTASGTHNYLWNMSLALPSVSIEKKGAADLRYYVHSPSGSLLYSIDAVGNARHFYHFDESGNTRFVSNDAGALEASYAYTPFGVLQSKTGTLVNPFTWQGQGSLFDDGNGLYYVRARYYDANAGSFLSQDPVKSIAPKNINPYQYAFNDPFQFVDVSGADPGDASTAVGTITTGISVFAGGAGSIANVGGVSSLVGGVDLALKSNGIDSSNYTGGVNVGELASEVGLATVGTAIGTASTAVATAVATGTAVAAGAAAVATIGTAATIVGGVIASGNAVYKAGRAFSGMLDANKGVARSEDFLRVQEEKLRNRNAAISRRNLAKTFSEARQARQELDALEASMAAKEAALDARLAAARRNNAEFSRRDAVRQKGRN